MREAKTALITGITGQDGAYLSELLLAKGYAVHGIKRRSSSFNTARLEHLYQDPHVEDPRLVLHHGDMTDSTNIPILDLARLVANVVGFTGTITRDLSKPDGTPRKLIDSSRLLATGWQPRIGLRDGIAQVYDQYRQQVTP